MLYEAQTLCNSILNKLPNASLHPMTSVEDKKRRREICDVGTRSRAPTNPASPLQSQRKRNCRICGKPGHYLKTCKKPHVEFRPHASHELDRLAVNVHISLKQPLEGLAALELSDNDTLQFRKPNVVAVPHHRERQPVQPLLIPAAKLGGNIVALNEMGSTNSVSSFSGGAQPAAVVEAFSRICKVPCRWQGCAVVLNSLETLVLHVYKIHILEQNDTSRCQWEACTAELSDHTRLVAHAQTHILETIPCAYEDCNETFRKPWELVEHNVRHREQGTALKRSSRPTAGPQVLPLPELPQNIPAWATLAPAVWIPCIPRERREALTTWVLRNIC
ncbi:hypothetical protein B0H14DRAFT_3011785 [Mycena olivaceomarginata]|nr:hypothetical protein B0H14DRAFT_3011785 [Mycena olivaceomarginata]